MPGLWAMIMPTVAGRVGSCEKNHTTTIGLGGQRRKRLRLPCSWACAWARGGTPLSRFRKKCDKSCSHILELHTASLRRVLSARYYERPNERVVRPVTTRGRNISKEKPSSKGDNSKFRLRGLSSRNAMALLTMASPGSRPPALPRPLFPIHPLRRNTTPTFAHTSRPYNCQFRNIPATVVRFLERAVGLRNSQMGGSNLAVCAREKSCTGAKGVTSFHSLTACRLPAAESVAYARQRS